MTNHILLQICAYSFLRQINKRLCLIPNKPVLFSVNAFASTKSPHRHYIIFYIKNQGGRIGSFLVWWRCGDLPYSDCYRRSIACSRRGSHGDAVLRFFKIAINPRFGIKKEQPLLFLFWWRCGICSKRSLRNSEVSEFTRINAALARVPGFTLQSNGTAFAVQNPRIDNIEKQVEQGFNLFFVWWRCGDLNPGSSFYTRHLLHAYSVIKFSYRRSPTDGGFEEAENADLLTAVGKSVARSV